MPEAPELYLASKLVNSICSSRTFGGKVIKSDVSRQADVQWDCNSYKISSKSRGKEIMLTLTEVLETKEKCPKPRCTNIVVHFGMSGYFKLTSSSDIPKHSHLRFFTVHEKPQMVLNFVDTRRFGGWQERSDWSPDRGPDPISEYQLFRENIMQNLNDSVFKKPICEVMLNQKYFNGIGNYLRAEILYRAGIKPFDEAKTILEQLNVSAELKVKTETGDVLQLCNTVPKEVIDLGVASIYDPTTSKDEMQPFINWIQCYDKPNMNKARDRNKRTIWFHGEPGLLAPKGSSTTKRSKKSKNTGTSEERENMDVKEKPVKVSAKNKRTVEVAVKDEVPSLKRVTRNRAKPSS